MAGHNKIYNCPFAANGYVLDAFPECEEDTVDMSEDSPDLKEKMRNIIYRKDFVKACDFCAGRSYSMPNIEPAIQTKKPILYVKYE